METRTCKKCLETRPSQQFRFSHGYFRRTCKTCDSKQASQLRKNTAHLRTTKTETEKLPTKFCTSCKMLLDNNELNFRWMKHIGYFQSRCTPCELFEAREYKVKHAKKHKQDWKNYYQKNRERLVDAQTMRIKKDPLLKLKNTVSRQLRKRLAQKRNSTVEYLGCTISELRQHLIQTAINKYGFYSPDIAYHIDHVIPCAFAKTEQELTALFHFSNLQYLTPEDNLRKGAKIN